MSTYATLIRGARVVDGTGNPWMYGDVALDADRIAAVAPPGSIPAESAADVVDATGHVVCPGFIDIQSHAILPLMIDGRCLSKITQGITTEIMGEAWTPAPVGGRNSDPMANALFTLDVGDAWEERIRSWRRFGDWLQAMEDHGVSPNVGSFLGGGTVRAYAKGMEMGQPSDDELTTMRRVMAEAMEDGAFGASYALIYPPDSYTDTEELIEVCKVVGRYGGIYITHMRSEAERIFEALDETLRIGREADLPVEIYHLKASSPDSWWKMPSVIDRIRRARADGIDVTADMYPYPASGTGLTAILPTWTAAGGRLYETLADPKARTRIRAALDGTSDDDGLGLETRGGPHGIMPIGFEKEENKQYVGKRLDEIAAMRDQDWIEATLDLLVSEGQRISTIYFSMDEANLRIQVGQPWIKFSTDAGGFDPAWARPLGPYHPRAYGTYPRVLRKYVREEGLLTLEEAVRKSSGAVADRLGLRHRGQLRAGFYADVVVFNPETITDNATFDDPHQLSEGVRDVWVNGERVLRDGEHTGATPGRFVKDQEQTEMIIEWNHHLFSSDTEQYPFHPRAVYVPEPEGRSPDPLADYLARMEAEGIDRAVVVHPEPYGDDHSLVLDALRREPERLRGTALFYPDDPEAPGKLRALVAREPKIVAVRFHAHRGKEEYLDSFADPGVVALWETAADLGLIVELHIGPDYAAQTADLIRAHPQTPVLIDHLAEPHLGNAVEYADVLALAQFDNLIMKLSGLNHFAADAPLYESACPFTRRVADAFGPDRMVWGSGTPAIVDAHLAHFSEMERAQVKGRNLAALLGWGDGEEPVRA